MEGSDEMWGLTAGGVFTAVVTFLTLGVYVLLALNAVLYGLISQHDDDGLCSYGGRALPCGSSVYAVVFSFTIFWTMQIAASLLRSLVFSTSSSDANMNGAMQGLHDLATTLTARRFYDEPKFPGLTIMYKKMSVLNLFLGGATVGIVFGAAAFLVIGESGDGVECSSNMPATDAMETRLQRMLGNTDEAIVGLKAAAGDDWGEEFEGGCIAATGMRGQMYWWMIDDCEVGTDQEAWYNTCPKVVTTATATTYQDYLRDLDVTFQLKGWGRRTPKDATDTCYETPPAAPVGPGRRMLAAGAGPGDVDGCSVFRSYTNNWSFGMYYWFMFSLTTAVVVSFHAYAVVMHYTMKDSDNYSPYGERYGGRGSMFYNGDSVLDGHTAWKERVASRPVFGVESGARLAQYNGQTAAVGVKKV
jgi:hypothetical protein